MLAVKANGASFLDLTGTFLWRRAGPAETAGTQVSGQELSGAVRSGQNRASDGGCRGRSLRVGTRVKIRPVPVRDCDG